MDAPQFVTYGILGLGTLLTGYLLYSIFFDKPRDVIGLSEEERRKHLVAYLNRPMYVDITDHFDEWRAWKEAMRKK